MSDERGRETRKGEYVRLADRVAKDKKYELVEPFDYMILDAIPVVGTTLSGLYELGELVSSLQKKFSEVSSGVIMGRLRSLETQGLTKKVKTLGAGSNKWAWQATEEGKALVEKWKGTNGNS